MSNFITCASCAMIVEANKNFPSVAVAGDFATGTALFIELL
jgi:hypothetical protein